MWSFAVFMLGVCACITALLGAYIWQATDPRIIVRCFTFYFITIWIAAIAVACSFGAQQALMIEMADIRGAAGEQLVIYSYIPLVVVIGLPLIGAFIWRPASSDEGLDKNHESGGRDGAEDSHGTSAGA